MSLVLIDQIVRLACKATARIKVLLLIEHYLQPEPVMSPVQAASLYGKCQWVLLYGQIGRSALSAIKNLQYSKAISKSGDSVSSRIRDTIA